MGGLFGLIALNLGGMVSGMIYGPNAFMVAAHSLDMYLGTAIFTALIAYDTHGAIESYKNGNPDHLNVLYS